MTNDAYDISSSSRLSCPLGGLFCEVPVRGFWPLKKNRASAFFLFLSRCSLYILLFHSLKGALITRSSLILMESKGKALNVELKGYCWSCFSLWTKARLQQMKEVKSLFWEREKESCHLPHLQSSGPQVWLHPSPPVARTFYPSFHARCPWFQHPSDKIPL